MQVSRSHLRSSASAQEMTLFFTSTAGDSAVRLSVNPTLKQTKFPTIHVSKFRTTRAPKRKSSLIDYLIAPQLTIVATIFKVTSSK